MAAGENQKDYNSGGLFSSPKSYCTYLVLTRSHVCAFSASSFALEVTVGQGCSREGLAMRDHSLRPGARFSWAAVFLNRKTRALSDSAFQAEVTLFGKSFYDVLCSFIVMIGGQVP